LIQKKTVILQFFFKKLSFGSNCLLGYFTLGQFCDKASGLVSEEDLIRMFNNNNKEKDGKMTFPDYIRMIVSKNAHFDLSDKTLNEIEQKFITPR
jgi:Ca2+-binding EF-hand superfamily protein